MRNYLLGILTPEERSTVEERILADPQAYEALLAVERVLIDEYLAGGLSTSEKHQFETHFLTTAQRQKNLRFGQLAMRRLNASPVHLNKTAPASSLPNSLARFRKVPTLAVSGALLVTLGVFFFSWLIARQPTEDLLSMNAPGLVVVTLSRGSTITRGSTQILIPTRGVAVKLELELTNIGFHRYRSRLFRGSDLLDTRDELRMEAKSGHHIVPLLLARRLLTPGEYQVQLSGVLDSGGDQLIDTYPFTVTGQ